MRDRASRVLLPRLDEGTRSWAWSVLLVFRVPRVSKSQLDVAAHVAGPGFHYIPCALRPLGAWYRQHGHDLDGIARENGKVRMLLKEFGGGLVRVATHNHKRAHIIADIVDPALRDLFGFT